jgi:hypothetical protein
MKTKRFLSLLMPTAVCLAVVIPALGQQQVTPPPAIPVTTPVVIINNSSGDQTDPHVSGDLASYTDFADTTVHYYRFSTDSMFPSQRATAAPTFSPATTAGGFVLLVTTPPEIKSQSLTPGPRPS